MSKTAVEIVEKTLSGYWFAGPSYHPLAVFYVKFIRLGLQSGFEVMRVSNSFTWLGFEMLENFTELSKLEVVEDKELIAKLNSFAKKQLTIKSLNIGYSYLKEIEMLS